MRPRKLLLHREELNKLLGKTTEKGLTIVPLRMYLQERPGQGRDRARQGQEDLRQARDDQAPGSRPRDARGGQDAAGIIAPMKRSCWSSSGSSRSSSRALRAGCSDRAASTRRVDLIDAVPDGAEKRPRPEVFTVEDVTIAGVSHKAIVAKRAEPRRLARHGAGRRVAEGQPRHARTELDDAGRRRALQIVVTNGETSEELLNWCTSIRSRQPGDRQWKDLTLDLSAYAGETVDLIFNTYSEPDPPPVNRRGRSQRRPAALGRAAHRHRSSGRIARMTTRPAADVAVPLLDLDAQYRPIRDEILAAITRVCDSQRFILGPEVEALERELAAHARGRARRSRVSSGTDALLVALMALGIGPGDEVITPTYSFFATAGCVQPARRDAGVRRHRSGHVQRRSARPSRARSRRGRARSCPCTCSACAPTWIAILDDRARRAGVPVIEDAAQAIGARYHGRAGRHVRRGRLLLVLSVEEPRRVRRRRAGDDQRRRARARAPAAAQPRRGAEVLSTRASAATSGSTRCRRRCCA